MHENFGSCAATSGGGAMPAVPNTCFSSVLCHGCPETDRTDGTCAASLLRQLSFLKLKLHFCDFVFLNMYVMLGKFHLCHSLVRFPFLRLHNILLYHTFHVVSGAYSVFS